jgi:ketosteroid isomerase-like protein
MDWSLMLRRGALAVLLLAAPATALAQVSRPAAARDADEVKATMVQMWAALEAGDVARYASFVHPDFTQFGETDAYLAEGKSEEVRAMTDYLKRATGVHTEMHNAQVTVRGDVAWVTYYWTDGGTIDGKRSSSRGKSTRIFVREQGRWLCIHGHYTLAP